MCLTHRPERTRKLAARLEKKGYVIGYKVLQVRKCHGTGNSEKQTIASPYNTWYTWKPGWNKANKHRQFFIQEAKNAGSQNPKSIKYSNVPRLTKVHDGIHIFTNKQAAHFLIDNWLHSCVIVEVKCYKQDFVSSGYLDHFMNLQSAVFTKVYMKKEDYDEALKS